MIDWITILIWAVVAVIGIVGIIGTVRDKVIFRFILWFVCSLMLIFIFISVATNKFVVAFLIALVIAFIGVKNE